MKFPAKALVPKGGEMYCHIFENQRTGLARNLFWSITIEFEPIEYGDDKFACSMTCEWIPWQVPNWRELDRKRLRAGDDGTGIESSFYMTSHDTGTRTELSLQHRQANIFQIKMKMLVDFHGYYGGDANPAMAVAADVDAPFIGLLVNPDSLSPKPTTAKALRKVASEFVDLSVYEEPERRKPQGFIFRPAASK